MSRNPGRDDKILRLYHEGASKAEIAREVGVSRERVRQIIARAGADDAPRQPTKADRVEALIKAGKKSAEVAAEMGLTVPQVCQIAYRRGIRLSSGNREKTRERDQRICQLFERGESLEAIAKEVGIERKYVTQILRAHGHRHRAQRVSAAYLRQIEPEVRKVLRSEKQRRGIYARLASRFAVNYQVITAMEKRMILEEREALDAMGRYEP